MTIISYEKEIAKKKEHLFVPSVMIPVYSCLKSRECAGFFSTDSPAATA